MKTLRIGGATVNQIPLDWSNNISNILEATQEAKKQDITILSFPELSITGYGCEDLFLAPWVSGKALEQLQLLVPQTSGITICVGLPVRVHGIVYNGVAVISNKSILGIALKQNLARDGVHYEPRWFDAWRPGEITSIQLNGEEIRVGDLTFDVQGIRFGFEICEDAWRKTARPGYRLCQRGVDLIINPSASHFAMEKSMLREQEVVIDGSRFFNCAYLFVNLLGNEAGRMIYDGDIIIGQNGKLIAVNKRLTFRKFAILSAVIHFDDPSKTRVIPSQDQKEKNEELARAAALALFDYLRKSKARGYVLSLSGGADSSMCAVLVAEMVRRASAELGWENFCASLGLDPLRVAQDWKKAVGEILTCAYQGTKNSSENTLASARELADSIGAVFHQWQIDEEVNTYTTTIEQAIGRSLTWDQDDITLQNIQARTRSPIIWMLANIKRAVLLTTSNRSEGDVGYATMDGDTSGSLAPIAGLTKTFILQWLRWAEQHREYSGLHPVNNLQPTAELRPLERNQTDEADLMPYAILAQIEMHAIRDRKSPAQVFDEMKEQADEDLLKGWIRKFFRLWSANQWKRERLAPSFHLDDINVDPRSWCRFPILSSSFKEELENL